MSMVPIIWYADCWNKFSGYGAMSSNASFSNLAGILYGPVAFLESMFLSCLIMPQIEMLTLGIDMVLLVSKVDKLGSSCMNTL